MTLALAMLLGQACNPSDTEFVCKSGDQSVSGYKTLTHLALFTDGYLVGGESVGVYAPNGVATKTLVPATSGNGLLLKGRRSSSDTGANVIVGSETWKDGNQFCVNSGPPTTGAPAPLFCVAGNGDIHFGSAITSNGASAFSGSLIDRSGVAGHPALAREPGLQLQISGALGAREDIKNIDGSDPTCDGGSWTRHVDGGACRWNFAGEHGDNTFASSYPMHAGFLAEWSNPLSGTGARTDHRAFIDFNGAYAQNHQLPRASFPGPAVKVASNIGDLYYGALNSTLMYSFDQSHWSFMARADYVSNADAGWVQFAEQPSVDQLISLVAVLEARVTALEAACP